MECGFLVCNEWGMVITIVDQALSSSDLCTTQAQSESSEDWVHWYQNYPVPKTHTDVKLAWMCDKIREIKKIRSDETGKTAQLDRARGSSSAIPDMWGMRGKPRLIRSSDHMSRVFPHQPVHAISLSLRH